jgi:taurine--2-oxoglutarate transaminase
MAEHQNPPPRLDPPESEVQAEREVIVHKWSGWDRFEPTYIGGADGVRISEPDGTSYLDAMSQAWYANVGHHERRIAEAISRQAHELASVSAGGMSTAPRRRLASRLLQILPPSFARVFFGSNGSDATEMSLKMARLGTGRQGVVAFSGNYHGASMAATSVTGMPECREPFGEPVPGSVFVPYPNCYRCPLGLAYPQCDIACANLVEEAIQTQGTRRVGAIIGEVVKSVSGVVAPPPGYWKRIREIADRHDAWLIFDETVTGFGRTGSWFAMQHYGVTPDVLALGKGLTSGYQPLSATVFGERAASMISSQLASRPLFHGMSFEGHPVACAAGLANLDVIEHDGLIDRAATLGHELQGRLEALKERHRCVGDVRGLGLMWGIELVRDRSSREPFAPGQPFHTKHALPVDAAEWAWEQLFDTHHILVGGAASSLAPNIVQLAPPLTFTHADLDELVAGLDHVFGAIDAAYA